MMAWAVEFLEEKSGARVVVEDNDETGYAYFQDPTSGQQGFVWLYNVVPAPADYEVSPDDGPPVNPASYVRTIPFTRPNEDDFQVFWRMSEGVL
jgi:hypothetical protein